ncbi:MAG: CusA/CzcA family heavy metal efflux RND transporter [Melioribacteraceae bacterium]|nr:CusA/CzcA family heavy metal efflux RND transporter [Melioribacteraceae bacterium]MCF8353203.1 CusA/CzcA family heavy metal efflux RND transporter [Melioribacteraceae bacterium]MCF8395330.1 CusA/CzcA family heavy metal efflux RND transporter [Melioribacteraceae bacterium]MCF8418763.1 CusA/CzcA family heavy metal efflux RND transporter [Melioribacteraceae bacterium]
MVSQGTQKDGLIAKLIEWSINNKFLVIIFTLFLIGAGYWSLMNTPVDALPDLSDVQVIIYTEYPGQGPQIVEDQVTYPMTTKMLSVPYAQVVRGYSFFGFSMTYIIFEDGTDIYWARSRVLEYLSSMQNDLPQGVAPQLGPDATGLGWVYQYALQSDNHDLQELRSIQDWFLRYELSALPGVSEVASIGGFVKQYQVNVDPNKLASYRIPLSKIKKAIKQSNNDVGGKLLEISEMEFMVRGLGYIQGVDDLKKIVVGNAIETGTPIFLDDVANIDVGPELRRGLAEWNGEGETVGGIIVMRYGENALEVINRVKERLDELQSSLPEGVEIVTAYDRSDLINAAIDNLKNTLIEESIIVAIIIILFLLHVRSSLVAIFTLPTAVLAAYIIMKYQGINANIMSLGGIAIAIGAMVDAAIIMVENAHTHMVRDQEKPEEKRRPHWALVLESAKEVGPSIFYSLLVITVSFLPVFTLEQQEGRLFKPLAYTKTYSMGMAAILAVTIVPILIGFFVRGKMRKEESNPLTKLLTKIYHPVVDFVMKRRWWVIGSALIIMAITYLPYSKLGSEFMPPLYEGDLLYMPTTLPGISVTKAKEILQQTDKIIKSFPEVESVFGKIGRARTATDPAPLTMIETTIQLKDKSEWREDMTPDKLIEEMNAAIQIPGLTNAWTMPIKTRIDMLSTGIKTPVGIKISGPDLNVLQEIGQEIENVARTIPGTRSAYAERSAGGNYVDFKIDRDAIARYGLNIGDVQDVIMSAIGGMNISQTVEGLERYPINLRYQRDYRQNVEALKRVLVPIPTGGQVPLAELTDLQIKKGPPAIKSENARPNAWVYIDIKDIDVGTYVQEAQRVINEEVTLPAGYSIIWSGQYEYMQRSSKRLAMVVPLTLLLVIVLLYMNTKSVLKTSIILLALPFSMVGSIWFLYLADYNLSVAVWVGVIALLGISAETGVVMLLYLDIAYDKFKKQGLIKSLNDLREAIFEGAVKRIRPKMMTVMTTMLGLFPILIGVGIGSDVMKRIAAPMVGGIITSFIMELTLFPAIFYIVKKKEVLQLINSDSGNAKQIEGE